MEFPHGFTSVAEPPKIAAPSKKKSIHGVLGVDLITVGDHVELGQVGVKGGQEITKQTKVDDIKSLTIPIQTFVNLPFDEGFNTFVTRTWDPEYASEEPHESHTMPLDAHTSLEVNIKRHSQCATLRKLYHKGGSQRRAFGTEIRVSPFTLVALLWASPQTRLVQVLGVPTEPQNVFLEQLLDRVLTLFMRHQRAASHDPGLKPLVLQLGVAVRKRDYHQVLKLLTRGRLQFPTGQEPRDQQCLEEIVGLMPTMVFLRGFGLSPENEYRIQTTCVFGEAQNSNYLRFMRMITTHPTNIREENLIYQALLHHQDGATFGEPLGAPTTWFDRFKAWKEAHPTSNPKTYWTWVKNKAQEIEEQFEN